MQRLMVMERWGCQVKDFKTWRCKKALLLNYTSVLFIVFDFRRTRLGCLSYKIYVVEYHILGEKSQLFHLWGGDLSLRRVQNAKKCERMWSTGTPWERRGASALPCRFNALTGPKGGSIAVWSCTCALDWNTGELTLSPVLSSVPCMASRGHASSLEGSSCN